MANNYLPDDQNDLNFAQIYNLENAEEQREFLVDYWMKNAQLIYIPPVHPHAPNPQSIANHVDDDLIKELENFVFDGDSNRMLSNLPSKICKKVFKIKEIMCICKECSVDETCVLCLDCFLESEHRLHKYQLKTSKTGGCCDCGNPNAWKEHACCGRHRVLSEEDPADGLPDQVKKRAAVAIQAIIKYATLTLNKIDGIETRNSDENDEYYLVLYIKERKFDCYRVAKVLVEELAEADRLTKQSYIAQLAFEGRAVIGSNTYQNCYMMKTAFPFDLEPQLSLAIYRPSTIATQIFGIKTLQWLQNILRQSKELRRLFLDHILETRDNNIISYIFRNSHTMWRAVRFEWYQILTTGMLSEFESKKTFAKILAQHYALAKNFVYMVQNVNYEYYASYTLTLQIFTDVKIVHELITEHDMIRTVLDALYTEWKDFWDSYTNYTNSKYIFIESITTLVDLKCLLGCIPENVDENFRINFMDDLDMFLYVLAAVQDMNPVMEGQVTNVDFLVNPGLSFEFHLSKCITLIIKWLGSNTLYLLELYDKVVSEINIINEEAPRISQHLALYRLFAALRVQLAKNNIEVTSLRSETIVRMITPVLWYHGTIANYIVSHKVYDIDALFPNMIYLCDMWENDLRLLQIGASIINSDEFIELVSQEFMKELPVLDEPDDLQTRRLKLHFKSLKNNELFYMLILIIGERFTGVGEFTLEERVRNCIIQSFCHDSRNLNKSLSIPLGRQNSLEKILSEVAVLNGTNSPELREEYKKKWDLFYYQYTRYQIWQMHNGQPGKFKYLPPPKLLKLNSSFKKITKLLLTDQLFERIKQSFVDVIIFNNRNLYAMKILYLICYGLQEEESKNYDKFNFTKKAEKHRILKLLKEVKNYKQFQDVRDVILWAINKYEELLPSGSEARSSPEPESDLLTKAFENLTCNTVPSYSESANEKALWKTLENCTLETTKAEEVLLNSSKGIKLKVTTSTTALGRNQTSSSEVKERFRCAVCQKEEDLLANTLFFVGFLQKSNVLWNVNQHLYGSKSKFGAYLNFCGHVIHLKCWQSEKESQFDEGIHGSHSYLSDEVLFDCPECGKLCNTILFLLQPTSLRQENKAAQILTYENWLKSVTDLFEDVAWIDDELSEIESVGVSEVNIDFLDDTQLVYLLNVTCQILLDHDIPYGKVLMYAPLLMKTLIYTLCSVETSLRYTKNPLLDEPQYSIDYLVRMVAFLSVGLADYFKPSGSNWLVFIFQNQKQIGAITEMDPVEALVTLTFSLHVNTEKSKFDKIPTGISTEHYLLQVVFVAHIFSILALMDVDEVNSMETVEEGGGFDEIAEILKLLPKSNVKSLKAVWYYVQKATLPFLRCSALFFHALSDVPPPSSFLQYNGDNFATLCAYLDLPQTPKKLFESPEIKSLIKQWATHPALPRNSVKFHHLQAYKPSLIQLPENSIELFIKYSDFKCPGCPVVSSEKPEVLVCLVCGEKVCGNAFCLQGGNQGSYHHHLQKCGSSIGVFLNLNACSLAYMELYNNRGRNVPPPYISDDTLETDVKPTWEDRLKLCPKRYKAINTLWVTHGLHDFISRSVRDIVGAFEKLFITQLPSVD